MPSASLDQIRSRIGSDIGTSGWITVEIEAEPKPALTAQWLGMLFV